jgi:uncharacterized membrane protein
LKNYANQIELKEIGKETLFVVCLTVDFLVSFCFLVWNFSEEFSGGFLGVFGLEIF